ncbi:MAG: sulfotransferase [Solirubrobacterales bacterium]
MSDPAELVFVGGTGRSGTTVISHLLDHHSRFRGVPIECRFHCNPRGLADVVGGRATVDQFLRKLRTYWWYRIRVGERALVPAGVIGRSRVALHRAVARLGRNGEGRVRGLHRIVDREPFERAVARFEESSGRDLVGASRTLFYDLLGPLAERAGKPALVEMSCFTIASAPELAEVFPEARFVHAVRDGRDSGASKVELREKPHHPTDPASGIDFWADRLRRAEEGVRGLDAAGRSRLRVVGLDELVWGDREDAYGGLLDFLGVEDEPVTRAFFDREMTADAAHRERWREGLDASEQREITARYEATLGRLEGEGYHCADVLRRSYERTLALQPGR